MSDKKQALWECINWYMASWGTEHESQERKVLDQAIDAALAGVSNDKLRELVAEWERNAKHQRTLMESVDIEEGAVAAGRMAVFEGCAGELEAALADSGTDHGMAHGEHLKGILRAALTAQKEGK